VATVEEMRKPIACVLAGLYCLLVAQLTLRTPAQGQWAFSFADAFATRASSGELTWSQTEVLANVALFVPLGFLLTLALGRAGIAVVCCVLLSAAIEYAQLRYLPSRVPSVADVEHNSFGGALGALAGFAVNLTATGAGGARRDSGRRTV
jgi:glycopeptide antibiotics resistance protein